jgi:hypothetical protein
MPVIEVVLAAVGLSVGGPRAWRKLRGLPEEDGACVAPLLLPPPGVGALLPLPLLPAKAAAS